MKVKSKSEVAQSCLTLRDTTDCSLPGSAIHGNFQARILEWVAIAFSVIRVYLRTVKNVSDDFFVKTTEGLRKMTTTEENPLDK